MAEVTVTDKTFEADVVRADGPVLVDFWAPWCGPCQMQNPILEELAEEFTGKAKIVKVNVDENQESAGKYMVMSIPTLLLFNKGQVVKQMVGVQSKEKLADELNRLIG